MATAPFRRRFIICCYSGFVSIFLGKGDGTFQAPINSAPTFAAGLELADFNGDGAIDVALARRISPLPKTGGSTLTLTSSKNPSQLGDRVTFARKVLPTFPVGTPTGTMEFLTAPNRSAPPRFLTAKPN